MTKIFSTVAALSLSSLLAPLAHASAVDLTPLTKRYGASLVTELGALERAGLDSGSALRPPHGGSNWAFYLGGIGYRYLAPDVARSLDWQRNRDYVKSHPVESTPAAELSPAEKYDLLVGDSSMSLTSYSWAQGEAYVKRGGNVPGWVGLSHGAAASSTATAPRHDVVVTAANGTKITFHPADISALLTQLWAQAAPPVSLVGNRCNSEDLNSPSCRDPNPAAFHLALVHELGLNKKSFILDAAAGPDVWNVALARYKLRYFNPVTGEEAATAEGARAGVAEFEESAQPVDRAPGTRWVVNVLTNLSIPLAVTPGLGVPSPRFSHLEFDYDLELDAAGNVIGGTWRRPGQHPDFLWFVDGGQPVTAQDRALDGAAWAAEQDGPVPAAWATPAREAALRGAPLATVVYRLLELSQR